MGAIGGDGGSELEPFGGGDYVLPFPFFNIW